MITTCIFLRCKDNLDPFSSHGDVASQRIRQLNPNIAGYVQARALDTQLDPDVAPAYAGMAQLWFKEPKHALAQQREIAQLAALWREDVVEVAGVVSGHDRTVMRLPAHHSSEQIKGVFPFRRKAGMSVEAFQHHWWHNHGPIAALTEAALCYTQCHVLGASYTTKQPDFDGVTQLYWANFLDAKSAMASTQMREDQSNDAGNFVDRDSVELFLAMEEVVLAP